MATTTTTTDKIETETYILDGIPEESTKVPESFQKYTNVKYVSVVGWHKGTLLIKTRAENTNQFHQVLQPCGTPGGAVFPKTVHMHKLVAL